MSEDTNVKRKNVGPGGPLYDLVMSKLPKYHVVHGRPKLALYKVAETTGLSPQHLYQVFSINREKPIPFTTARKLVDCSVAQEGLPKKFEPLTILDLEPFLPS
jgi:hypothetical protein